MKKTSIIILASIFMHSHLNAQTFDSCFGGRYENNVFLWSSILTTDVQYGQNINISNQTENLMARIFTPPLSDTITKRPLVLLQHPGGWTNGNYMDPGTIGVARDFARRGYVAVSVGYRLGIQNNNYTEVIYL